MITGTEGPDNLTGNLAANLLAATADATITIQGDARHFTGFVL